MKPRSLVLAAVTGVALLLPTSIADAVTPAARVPSTVVTPDSLPRGAAPQVPWLDGSHDRIVRPGRSPLSTEGALTPNGGRPRLLLHVRGGYLLDSPLYVEYHGGVRQTGTRLFLVRDTGRTRTVVDELPAAEYPVVASTDGRRVVLRHSSTGRLRVLRISDGRVLGALAPGKRSYPQVMAVGPQRVLVQNVVERTRTSFAVQVLSWEPGHRARVLSRHVAQRRDEVPVIPGAGSIAGQRYATYAGDHALVTSARTGRTLWRTARGEVPLAFSPDDQRVVTVAGYRPGDEQNTWIDTARTVRVRAAGTGRVLATFTGRIEVGELDRQPLWESSGSLLLHVTGPGAAAVARCKVATARCSKVPARASGPAVSLVVRRSN